MHRQPYMTPTANRLASATAFSYPVQILVLDIVNGPADILVNTISLLLDADVSVMLVDDPADALRALEYYSFDLIVIGLHEKRPLQLAIVPSIRAQASERPVLAVGRRPSQRHRRYAHHYGVREVVALPERAADLKALVARVVSRYLAAA